MIVQFAPQARSAKFGKTSPNFPRDLSLLNQMMPSSGWSCALLVRLAERIEGYVGTEFITTSDNYTWVVALKFQTSKGPVYIAFPGSKHGIADRSIAVYCDRLITDVTEILDQIMDLLLERLI